MAETWPFDVNWAAVDAHFQVPAELNQPVPRRVAPRQAAMGWRQRISWGCLSGCLSPLLVLGVLMALWGGLTALILPFGAQTSGVVTAREKGSGRDKTYTLDFRFRVRKRDYDGQWQVPTQRWKQIRVGAPVRVRYFAFAPGLHPIMEDGVSPWVSILVLAPFGLVIAVVSGVPLLALFERREGKSLVRYGVVAPAFVVKRDDGLRKITFLVRDENERVFEVETSAKDTANHYAGQTETALYRRNKPQKARLYRGLDWKGAPD